MTTLLVVMLIVVATLLGWVVKFLMTAPKDASGKSENRDGGSPFQKAIRERNPSEFEDIQDMSDRLMRRIDKKIDTLKDLLKEADKRIETMNRGGHVLPAEYPVEEKRAAAGPVSEKRKESNERRARIVALRHKGATSEQIAREVGMGQGEVELILKIEGYA